jgi:hypothetical protein
MSDNKSTEITLGGTAYVLTWDKGAMYDADEVGVWAGKVQGGIGLAQAAKYVWAMLPPAGRAAYPTPRDVARVLPPLVDVWPAINNALNNATEDTRPGNVVGTVAGVNGSTSGPSPSSNSARRAQTTGA